jgi:hypothetical protein
MKFHVCRVFWARNVWGHILGLIVRASSIKLNFRYGISHEARLWGGRVVVGGVILQRLGVALSLLLRRRLGLLKLPHVPELLMLILRPTAVVVLWAAARSAIIIVLAVIIFPVRSLVVPSVFVVVVPIISTLSLPSKVLIAAGAATDISASKPTSLFVAL